MPQYRYEHRINSNIRRSREDQEKFLKWLNSHSEFKTRKPTVKEIVHELRRGCLKELVEQDPQKAAERYWRSEAQYWIRHVEVIRIDVKINEQVGKPMKAYIPISVSYGGRVAEGDYIPAPKIASNSQMKMDVVAQARADLEAWIQRYERYTEFFQVYDSVIAAFRKLEKKLNKKAG